VSSVDDEAIKAAIKHLEDAAIMLRTVLHERGVSFHETRILDEGILSKRPGDVLDFGQQYNARIQHNLFDYGGKVQRGGHYPIDTIGELVSMSERDILRLPNLGRSSLERLKAALAVHGLELGMFR